MSREPVSIIVPTYQESENISVLTQRLFAALKAKDLSAELIIVDDDSRDGTQEAVYRLAEDYPIRLVTRTNERGLSSAVLRGFAEARHDILLCMDADLSHPPESVPDLVQPIMDNQADFCIGSRYVKGGRTLEDWGWMRRINSWGATLLARPLTPARDPMAGFFCLRRSTFDQARAAGLNPIGYKIALEMLVKAQCRQIVEVPIEFSDRMHGKSKLTLRQQYLYLCHLVRLYWFCRPVGTITVAILLFMLLIAAVYWARSILAS